METHPARLAAPVVVGLETRPREEVPEALFARLRSGDPFSFLPVHRGLRCFPAGFAEGRFGDAIVRVGGVTVAAVEVDPAHPAAAVRRRRAAGGPRVELLAALPALLRSRRVADAEGWSQSRSGPLFGS